MSGKVVLSVSMAISKGARSALLSNRSTFEALGIEIATDGSSVIFPSGTPAGWKVVLGDATTYIDKEGNFTITVVAGGATEGSISPPSEEIAWTSFSVDDLKPEGQAPSSIVVEIDFQGGCCMEAGNACCQPAPTEGGLTLRPRESTYPTGTETECLDYDGPVFTGDKTSEIAYLGSTCFNRVLAGCCPNEGGTPGQHFFPQFYTYASCNENHKGRFCQEVTPGDLVVTPQGQTLVDLDTSTPFNVHNNGCFGETHVQKTRDEIGGEFTIESYFDGSTVKHYRGQSVANFNYEGTDRTLTYVSPACVDSASLQDEYTFEADGETQSITIGLDPSGLWQFTSGASSGTIFSVNRSVEDGFTFGSSDLGCDGLHVHGNHPCTGEADPDPTGCGHGKVSPVPAS